MDKERRDKIERLERLNLTAMVDTERLFHNAYVELMMNGLMVDEMERDVLFNLGLIQEKYEDLSAHYNPQ
jgi:peptide methionine sulfoxide reductase MsrB